MARPVVIIHFQPLEWYPPVMNLLDYAGTHHPGAKLVVCTTGGSGQEPFTVSGSGTDIKRLARFDKAQPGYSRYFNYLLFYLRCFLVLCRKRPAAILYYETLSSWPVWLYKKWIAKKTPVFIHYHEYSSPAEYAGGMWLNRYFHNKEKWLYPRAAWISHTNEDRLQQFSRDENLDMRKQGHVLPNYPPQAWVQQKERNAGLPLKIVYIGALGLDTMYTEAFARWVLAQEGKVIWHIYTHNISADARRFIESVQGDWIRLYPGVAYHSLPAVLRQYDIGVILYNGHIPNYVYNAPNKLFEYMACGLDTWCPDVVKGCIPYITHGTWPKVVSFDFSSPRIEPAEAFDTKGYTGTTPVFFYEKVYPFLTQKLLENAG